MKFLDKMKGLMTKKVGKIIGFAILGAGNVAAVTVTTIAWFNVATQSSNIEMVSGDLGVEIQTVTAYKYVYPFYKNSTEFIDYDNGGTVKKYVIEDHTLTFEEQLVDKISITSDDATVTLGSRTSGTYSSVLNATHTSYNIYFSDVDDFRYYLIGDDVFCGDSSKAWSIQAAIPFSNNETVSNQNPAIAHDVVVSAGASFILFDKNGASNNNCHYFPYNSIAESNSSFRAIDTNDDDVADALYCLRSGIYTFTYTPNTLKIDLQSNGNQKDIAVVGNNSLDPTKISIDYAGSANKQTYPTINDYVAHAVSEQNTMLILDVQINYKNANSIEAGLLIERNASNSASIYNDTNHYSNTVKNLVGYVNEQNRNALNASDFYSFYAIFTKTPYTAVSESDVPTAIWDGVHRESSAAFTKFNNETSYDRSIICVLHPKDQNDTTTTLVPPAPGDNIYHCYIGIEYDYVYTRYFLNENRLGKTYLLDRDFGFHFTAVQALEENS